MYACIALYQSLLHTLTLSNNEFWWALWGTQMIENIEHQILMLMTPLKGAAGIRK